MSWRVGCGGFEHEALRSQLVCAQKLLAKPMLRKTDTRRERNFSRLSMQVDYIVAHKLWPPDEEGLQINFTNVNCKIYL